jgi:hypothetical protein
LARFGGVASWLAGGLPFLSRARSRRSVMLESIRKAVITIPEVPVQALLSIGAVASFGWLLLEDRVHPLLVYCLELYLSL